MFFAGSDGTATNPGHVGLVIGGGKMIEAYATGFPIRISTYGGSSSAAGCHRWWGSPGPGPMPASACRRGRVGGPVTLSRPPRRRSR